MKTRLLIVGYGNMARAILKGFAKNAPRLQNYHIQITGRNPEKIRPFLDTLPLEVEIVPLRMRGEHYKEKVNPTDTPSYYNANIGGYAGWIEPALSVSTGYRLVADVDVEQAVVLLAMKPHALESFSYQGTALLVLSVLAGVDIQALKECVKSHVYVRCMPNVAASYGLSATTYYVDSAYNPRYVYARDCYGHQILNGNPIEDQEWKREWFSSEFLYLEEECEPDVNDQSKPFNRLMSVKKAYMLQQKPIDCSDDDIAEHQEHLKRQINPYVREILKCFGSCVEVQSEALIDASLATNGSSLAFLSMAAQALVSAGVREGLSVNQASELVEQSFKGFAQLLQESDPQEIIDSICTPGGATIAGLSVLEEKAFKGILMQACHIAVRKGRTKFKSS
ncbi:pyrroline-5-carboxylate reductase [Helicobacter felis]|uniref:pyrroline-5-carboxylate reductase n=1 Tax=Helicobacter felis TaxID=214 RepID=UPI000CF0AFED|nr:pyrroline-5-carboxylate reductase [Helicobacter felis]